MPPDSRAFVLAISDAGDHAMRGALPLLELRVQFYIDNLRSPARNARKRTRGGSGKLERTGTTSTSDYWCLITDKETTPASGLVQAQPSHETKDNRARYLSTFSMVLRSFYGSFILPSRLLLSVGNSALHRGPPPQRSSWRRRLATTGRSRFPTLPTLDPFKLTEECFRDISYRNYYRFRTPEMLPEKDDLHTVSYASGYSKHYPFPPATSGFFYYHPPLPGAPDIAGDIRFRITNNADPRSFAYGTDLTLHGLPWLMPLVPNSRASGRFLPSLRRDSLLTDEQVRRIRMFGIKEPLRRRDRPIFAFGQPFRLYTCCRQAAQRPEAVRRVVWTLGVHDGEDKLERTSLFKESLAKWGYQQPGQPPREFSTLGTAIVHFEKQMFLPSRGPQRPAAKLRIRQMVHLFGSEERGEHPDAGAAGCLLLVHTEKLGWHEWHRYLDRESRNALTLLRDMPEVTEF